MKSRVLSVVLVASCLATVGTIASAQSISQKPVKPVDATSSENQVHQLFEDIEILRRLLDMDVKRMYAAGSGSAVQRSSGMSPSGMSGVYTGWIAGGPIQTATATQQEIREPIGTFINGHGVVYQFELPSLAKLTHPQKNKTDSLDNCPIMSLSKWERTRRHLTGDLKKIKCLSCHEGSTWKSADDYFKFLKSARGNSKLTFTFSDFTLNKSRSGPTRQELVNHLVHLLAENGHNIRVLSASQSLTLAISFRKPKSPSPRGGAMMGSMGMMSGSGMGGMGAMMGMENSGGASGYSDMVDGGESADGQQRRKSSRNNVLGSAGTVVPGSASGGGLDSSSEGYGGGFGGGFGGGLSGTGTPGAGNEELTGDLHMRQGNYKKAVEEYAKAFKKSYGVDFSELTEISIGLLEVATENGRKIVVYLGSEKSVRLNDSRLIRKLGAAQFNANNLEAARKLLDVLSYIEKATKKTKPIVPGKSTPKAISLPTQLIISVTKEHLDAVGIGTITHEEFRKKVSIDYIDPTAVTSKPEANNKTGDVSKKKDTKR